MDGILGVLGGMGPLATVDFFQKIVEEARVSSDQQHVPLIIDSVPQIPCRVSAILRGGESPFPHMLAGLQRLERAGAECCVIACNTAHFWYDELCEASRLPILHIVDAVGDELAQRGDDRPIGLLATEATLAAGIYQKRLSDRQLEFIVNSPQERAEWIAPAIALVKEHKSELAGPLLEQALQSLLRRGAGTCVLACTELPVALGASRSDLLAHCIDASRALARAAVRWSMERRREVAAHAAQGNTAAT